MIEYLDGVTLSYSGDTYPFGLPEGAAFMVITEADGADAEARRVAAELHAALADDAVAVHAPEAAQRSPSCGAGGAACAFAILAQRGGAFSEDIAVPLDRLRDVARETLEIGERHGDPVAVVRPRGRREHPLDVPLLARRSRRGQARRRRLPRAVRAGADTRRHRHRRARHRLAEARPAPAPARPGRLRPAHARSSRPSTRKAC